MIESVSIAPIFAFSALFFAMATTFVYFMIIYCMMLVIAWATSKLVRPIYLIITR